MKQRPYSSPLWEHANLIRNLRLKRQSWQSIVDVLKAEHGVQINYRSVQAFFKRLVKRKALPLGWEIEPRQNANRPSLKQAPVELQQIREKEKRESAWPTREEADQILQ
jgi:hypothetical protein